MPHWGRLHKRSSARVLWHRAPALPTAPQEAESRVGPPVNQKPCLSLRCACSDSSWFLWTPVLVPPPFPHPPSQAGELQDLCVSQAKECGENTRPCLNEEGYKVVEVLWLVLQVWGLPLTGPSPTCPGSNSSWTLAVEKAESTVHTAVDTVTLWGTHRIVVLLHL